ncbi:MAG: GNAT family N-acetyltransferase [Gaiellaceae bacterium]
MPVAHLNPIIRGENVWLRPFERDDIEPSLAAINDREISDLVGFWGPISKPMSDTWFEEEVLKKHGERAFFFTICKLGSAELIGQCGLHDVTPAVRADVGIFLLPEHCGRGHGTDAMNALLDYAFGELGLHRIGLHVSPGNDRAIRSYEKCGFRHEGRLRAFRRRRGEVVDDLVMSIVRSDWEALERLKSWELPAPQAKPKPRAKKGRAAAPRK